MRAQLWLIGVVCLVSFPLIAYGRDFGWPVSGFVFPVGVGVITGAFLFGFGMQFGGGCGSGTLFSAGGGSTRMVITLAAFIAGSLIGTFHAPWWGQLPRVSSWSMVREFGAFPALGLMLIVLIVLGLATVWLERRAHGSLEQTSGTGSWITGPWSTTAGIVGLAIVSVATLIIVGRPWGITFAYAVWGAKIVDAFGFDLSVWSFWKNRQGLIDRSVFTHFTSVMNFGIVAGAMAAASLSGRFVPKFKLTGIDVATAIFGGLLMGYGARLAYGCNIGAYVGGLISGSLHGWVWLVAAFIGSTVAVWFKTRFRIP